MKNKTTLKDLSRLLKVSVSTVSKALNNSPEIGNITKERVKKMADFYQYRPNPTALNLQSSKSGTIGVIIPNISNSFFARVLSGIEEEAQKEGLKVITYISNESLIREQEITWLLSSGFVDGVLVAFSEETQRNKEFSHLFNLIEYDIPVVLYNRIGFDFQVDKIGINDEQSLCEATKFFISQEVQKIGLASAIPNLDVGKLRIRGYKKAIKNKDHFLIAKSSNKEVLRCKIKKLLMEEKVQAMLCTDFESTMLVYRLAYKNEIKIPETLKLIGFLNEDYSRALGPSVSYIEQFPEKIGRKGMQLLLKRMRGFSKKGAITEKKIPTELIHLESTKF